MKGIILVSIAICVGTGLFTGCGSDTPVTHEATSTAAIHKAVPTIDSCPLDDFMAYVEGGSAIMDRARDVLEDTQDTQTLSDFGRLHDRAVKIRDDAEELDAPPCVADIQRTVLRGLDAVVDSLAAAEEGDIDATRSYAKKAVAVFGSAADQLEQLKRDLSGERNTPTSDYCPLDDVVAYLGATSAIAYRSSDVSDRAANATTFSDFGPLRDEAARIRDDVEELDVPPCAADHHRTILEAFDAMVSGLGASEEGDIDATIRYNDEAMALWQSATDQANQLRRDLFQEGAPPVATPQVQTAQDNLLMAKAMRDLFSQMKVAQSPAVQSLFTTEMREADMLARSQVGYLCDMTEGKIGGHGWIIEGHWRTVFSQACDKVYGVIVEYDPYQADLYDDAIKILGDAIVAAEGE